MMWLCSVIAYHFYTSLGIYLNNKIPRSNFGYLSLDLNKKSYLYKNETAQKSNYLPAATVLMLSINEPETATLIRRSFPPYSTPIPTQTEQNACLGTTVAYRSNQSQK